MRSLTATLDDPPVALVSPVHVIDAQIVNEPAGVYLLPGHTWVKIEPSSTVRVFLDDFALRLLGPLDQIQAPLMGKQLEQGR